MPRKTTERKAARTMDIEHLHTLTSEIDDVVESAAWSFWSGICW